MFMDIVLLEQNPDIEANFSIHIFISERFENIKIIYYSIKKWKKQWMNLSKNIFQH